MEQNNQLIKITTNEKGQQLASARELHEFLEIKTEFRKWFPRMCEYGFAENQDYIRVSQKCPTLGGVQEQVDYAITIDMGKELSMIQRTEKGKQARQYFITCEKKLKEVNSKAQLLLSIYNGGQSAVIASKQLTEIEVQEATKPLLGKIEEDAPLVRLAKERLDSNGLISITDATKTFELKRGKITKWAKKHGYLHKTNTEVNQLGNQYFKVYDAKGFRCIGINENGLKLINDNLDIIKIQ